jgi:hypothetical protein
VTELLPLAELPEGFRYPTEFVRVVDLGITRLEPWWIIEGNLLIRRHRDMRTRYPGRTLVPFAVRQDNDDVASFDVDAGNVAIVHEFASPGWEHVSFADDFYSWFRRAIEDFIAFE